MCLSCLSPQLWPAAGSRVGGFVDAWPVYGSLDPTFLIRFVLQMSAQGILPGDPILAPVIRYVVVPTLAVGLLDFKVDVVLARLEADFSDQPQTIPAVPNRKVSQQCPATKYPCSAQPQSIPAVPIRRVSLHCPTAKYPCSAQPQSILAVPNRKVSLPMPNCKVSLQCPTAQSPCSVQPPNIPAGPNRQVSLQCPSAEYPWSAQQQSINILAAHLQCCKEDS